MAFLFRRLLRLISITVSYLRTSIAISLAKLTKVVMHKAFVDSLMINTNYMKVRCKIITCMVLDASSIAMEVQEWDGGKKASLTEMESVIIRMAK